jgi:putative ATP-binding cassette transporter
MKSMIKIIFQTCLGIAFLFCYTYSFSYPDKSQEEEIEKEVRQTLKEGEIPGLSLVIIIGDKVFFKNYGYANIDAKTPVTENSLFQLGSCSKAFTALAVIKLANEGFINLDEKVSTYIPWFSVYYKKRKVDITIRQLLNHTSGIPWNTIAKIPQTNAPDALVQTVRTLVDSKLHSVPGDQFEYATINYDILALVVENVTKLSFEKYLQQQILGPLQLNYTSIGEPVNVNIMSAGYKIGFFKPRRYNAPVFKGNNAAGYVTTNATDMAKWLTYQMELDSTSLSTAIRQTHQHDETVPPVNNKFYAAGWFKSLEGDNVLFHGGLNPNFTSFIGFNAREHYGVVVLANSNSAYTEIMGRNLLRILSGKEVENDPVPDDNSDRACSAVSFILMVYILVAFLFIAYIIFGIVKSTRSFQPINVSKAGEAILSIVMIIPFLYGLYKLPNAIAGFTWDAIEVWMPLSFSVMIKLIVASIVISYISYFFTLWFPDKSKLKGALPRLLLVSALSGIANLVLILLITSRLNSQMEMKFLIFYFGLTLSVYLIGRRFVQIRLIKLTRDLIYDLRIQLLDRIFKTSYQKFEKIDRGRIYTTFNDDVGTIGESTNMFIMLVTNLFTATAAMLYLATMAFWATSLTILLVLTLSSLYYFVSRTTHHYFEEARDSRNVFMTLLNGMIDGFKEISLHLNRKVLYKEDIAKSADEYRQKISTASIRYVNASLVGEVVLVLILGTAAFVFPVMFPDIRPSVITMFIIVLLYLIGPVNAILHSVPATMRLRVAWNRVQQFIKDIPASGETNIASVPIKADTIHSLKAEQVKFVYDNDDEHSFEVGPINFEVNRGEILFIIGGNGSGKTTLAKLLTGLYEPVEGAIFINGKKMLPSQLGDHFSTVFNPLHLFEKLYDIEVAEKTADIEKFLNLLDIKDKVQVLENGKFSTINLSGGQRKRLALLLCYLEDSPIYLFDEWAADQDPEYRRFFYRILLPEMREKGKIIIAITHDDHYFDIADKILKLNQGQLEEYYPKQNSVIEVNLQ